MSSVVGVVADDLTGGTTVGALLARTGTFPTVLFNHDQIEEPVTRDEQAIIVSTDSRAVEPEVAFGRVRHATEQLLGLGVRQLSKRIDTTCRGGVGPEVEGMMTALDEDATAIIVPAMPESRRIVVGGYSLIDSVLLASTDVARDVRTPVRESDLRSLFAPQFSSPIAHLELSDVLMGPDRVEERLEAIRDEGRRIVLADAVSLEDVDVIAQGAARTCHPVVAVDPGPFTVALAHHRGLLHRVDYPSRTLHVDPPEDSMGTVVVIAGSASVRTHEQIIRLVAEPGTDLFAADVLRLIGPEGVFLGECERLLKALRRRIVHEHHLRVAVLTLDTVISGGRTPRADLESASGLIGQQISTLLTDRLARLGRAFVDLIGSENLTGIYLSGGDVMVASCKALQARGLQMVDYVIPQVDQARLVGGPYSGIPVVCKGGLTGDEVTALQSVNRLFDERTFQS